MARTVSLPLVRILLPALFVLASAAGAAPPATPDFLAGRLLPAAAAAVARVEVWPQCPSLDASPRPLAIVRPGADGRFQVTPPDEPFRLRVEAAGFVPAERWMAPDDPTLPPLRMQRAQTLELALAGPDGAPLAEIPVVVFDESPAPGPDRWMPAEWTAAVTGPDGRALVPRRLDAPLALLVASPRFLGVHKLAAASPQRLKLTPGRPVAVKVVDPQGRPVPGAHIRLVTGKEITRADPRGRLELGVPAGAEGFPLRIEDDAGRQAEIVLGAATGSTLTVTLRPGREVAGRVLDSVTRQPLAGARVEAGCPAVARTGTDGSFRLVLGLREDYLAAQAPGYLDGGIDLRDAGAVGPFTLALQPATALVVRVVDEQGTAVAGAQVAAYPSSSSHEAPSLEAPSNSQGIARLAPAVADVLYQVTARRDGYALGEVAVPALREQAEPTLVVLTRGAALVGQLAGEGGEPAAGGEVSLRLERTFDLAVFNRPSETPLRAAIDREGRFELLQLQPGRYRLSARAPGLAPPAALPVEIPVGVRQVDLGTITLAAAVTLEGRVVDERDRPVVGAQVFLVGGPGDLPPAVSGADGGFRLSDLEPGPTTVWAVRQGYLQTTLRSLTAPSPEPVLIRLRTARGVTGRVVDPRGEPVSGAWIHRLHADAGNPGQFNGMSSLVTTDAEGRFAAGGLEPGPLTLEVQAAGYRSRRLRVAIPADRDAGPLEIALEAGAVVEGRVLAGGLPLAGARLFARPLDPGGSYTGTMATADGDGRYRLAGLTAGRHTIEVADDEGRQAQEELEVRPGRQESDFHLSAGELRGRVVDAEGRPVAIAGLSLLGPESRSVRSASDGSFAFRALPPGAYRISARHPEAGEGEFPEVQVAGEPIALPDLVLEQAEENAEISGRLAGLSLQELARVWVRAGPAPAAAVAGFRPQPVEGRVNADGTYRLTLLPPGTWQIVAGSGERRPVERQLQVAAGERAVLDLEFVAGATLTGRVTIDGRPAAGAQVQLSPEGVAAQTAGDGTFTLRDLPPGTYTVQLLLGTQLAREQEVEIDGDRRLDIELTATDFADGAAVPAGEPPTERP